MASPSLALPGVVFVGEDERARLVAHLGPAAGWMTPKGVLGWSTEVSVVARDALTEQIRRDAKIVMPEEQIPPAKLPLTREAAMNSPLIAVSSRLTQKLVDAGVRVHTVGADRVTSSFYYIAEGGGEPMVRAEGDLVASAGAMLDAGADNAAIDEALDGLADRLLRALSNDRVGELALELAAALPRAASDGSGLNDVDLESFEKELAKLVGGSEKYSALLQEIASKLGSAKDAKVEIPLFGDARKVSHTAASITVGDQTIALATLDRWIATGPLAEPQPAPAKSAPPPAVKAEPPPAAKPEPKPVAKAEPPPAAKPEPKPVAKAEPKPEPKPVAKAEPKPEPKPVAKAEPKPTPKPAEAKVATPKPAAAKVATPKPAEAAPANIKPLAAPIAAEPPKAEPAAAAKEAELEPTRPIETKPVEAKPAEAKPVEAKPVEAKPAEAKPVEAKAEVAAAKATTDEKPKAAAPKKEPAPSAIEKGAGAAVDKPEAKGGIPWLWILVLAAAAFAAYRLFLHH
jgi:hypothetical protein